VHLLGRDECDDPWLCIRASHSISMKLENSSAFSYPPSHTSLVGFLLVLGSGVTWEEKVQLFGFYTDQLAFCQLLS